jgi:prepilin peptidase CpaA
VSSAAFAVVAVGVLVAAAVDVRTRRIPNQLTGTLAALGLVLAAAGVTGTPLWASIAGLALGLALMLPGHALGATGAGDVKLMAAVGAVVGPATVFTAFLLTAIAGGALAVVVAWRRGRVGATLTETGRLLAGSGEARRGMRAAPPARRFAYGPAIAIGSVIAAALA